MLLKFLFLYHAVVIVVLSALVVTRRNPVHAILLMLIMFFHMAGLYLLLNAEFLAAVQIIVYAGAILVLFLFVVLLLNLRLEETAKIYAVRWPVGLVAATALLLIMFAAVKDIKLGPTGDFTTELIAAKTHTAALGYVLFTEFIFPFELASLVLLVAIIGAIVLAKKHLRA